MSTIHRDAAEAALQDFMSTADGLDALSTYQRRFEEGSWDQEYLDLVGQFHPRSPGWRSPAQVTSFMIVNHLWQSGYLAMTDVGTRGHTPQPDACREENAAALSNLPGPFYAKVDMAQDHADEDGLLCWDDDVHLERSTGLPYMAPDERRPRPLVMPYTLPRSHVPLEIGTSDASRTMMHLREDGGVARWPYGQARIRLWVMVRAYEPWNLLF